MNQEQDNNMFSNNKQGDFQNLNISDTISNQSEVLYSKPQVNKNDNIGSKYEPQNLVEDNANNFETSNFNEQKDVSTVESINTNISKINGDVNTNNIMKVGSKNIYSKKVIIAIILAIVGIFTIVLCALLFIKNNEFVGIKTNKNKNQIGIKTNKNKNQIGIKTNKNKNQIGIETSSVSQKENIDWNNFQILLKPSNKYIKLPINLQEYINIANFDICTRSGAAGSSDLDNAFCYKKPENGDSFLQSNDIDIINIYIENSNYKNYEDYTVYGLAESKHVRKNPNNRAVIYPGNLEVGKKISIDEILNTFENKPIENRSIYDGKGAFITYANKSENPNKVYSIMVNNDIIQEIQIIIK